MTFYGVDFFKSGAGVEVEFGKQLKHRVFRQVSASDAESIEKIQTVINTSLLMTFLPLLFFVGFGGRLLPTWMFLNSMQLFVHIPLLEIYLPGNLSYFLTNYLGYIRLKSGTITDGISQLDA